LNGPARFLTTLNGWLRLGSGRWSNNDGVSCALDDGEYLRPFLLRYLKLVERLVEVVDEGVPLVRSNQEMWMGVFHRTTRVPLRPPARLAELFCHQVLESRRQPAVARLVDARIRVQPVVDHD